MKSTQERQRPSSPPLLFSFDYKTIAQGVFRGCISHLPTCKSHMHSILMNHFLSITLSLTEFFSTLRYKGRWYWRSSEPLPQMTPERVSYTYIHNHRMIISCIAWGIICIFMDKKYLYYCHISAALGVVKISETTKAWNNSNLEASFNFTKFQSFIIFSYTSCFLK